MTVATGTDTLIDALTAEGQVTSHGDFTLDMLKARDKLREYQLLSPHLYVLELIGAAVNGGASAVDVDTGLGTISFVMRDVQPYSKTELAHLYSNLFLPQEDASLHRLRQLAIGLNSSLALNPRLVQVRSQSPNGQVRMELTTTEEGIEKDDQTDGSCITTVTVHDGVNWHTIKRLVPVFDDELAFIRGRCRHAHIPIRINKTAINRPVRMEPCLAQVTVERYGVQATLAIASSLPVGLKPYIEEKDRYGSLMWVTGVPLGTPLDDAKIVFMVAGIMLTEKRVALHPDMPVKVLCSAPGLVKNASQNDIVENARFQQVVDIMRDMLPDLMAEVQKEAAHMERVLANPQTWPAEGAATFRKYVKAELDLARRYLDTWAKTPGVARPAAELAVPVVEVATPESAEAAELRKKWLAYETLECSVGGGYMALSHGETCLPFKIVYQGHPVSLKVPFYPPRLTGELVLTEDPRDRDGTDLGAGVRNVVRAVIGEGVDRILGSLVVDYGTLLPDVQETARADLMAYISSDRKSFKEYEKTPITSLLGRTVRLRMFPATDGASMSLLDLLRQQQSTGVLHYTAVKLSGRSLDPNRHVLCLSEADRAALEPFIPATAMKEYSQELEQEERARQLQRERGMVTPMLDANRALAHVAWKQDGLDICLWLSRPSEETGTIRYYKHGVLVSERPLGELPCSGWVQGNDLAVDDTWTRVMVSDGLLETMGQQIQALYESVCGALARIDSVHPDYHTCCQYACRLLLAYRDGILANGTVPAGPAVAANAHIFPGRQGHLISFSTILERYLARDRKLEIATGRDLELVIPVGVVSLHQDRPWMWPFLSAFFGENVANWTLGATEAEVRLPRAGAATLQAALSDLFLQLRMDVRVRPPEDFTSDDLLCMWDHDTLTLNARHRLVRLVEKKRTRDPGVVLHLLLAVLSDHNRYDEMETGRQIQAVTAILRAAARGR